MSDARKQTIIEDGTQFDGSINSRCDVLIGGVVKGELLAPALTIGPSGSMHGMVKVEQLVSRGEISGEISADTVELSGRVGDHTVIQAHTLQVNLAQPDKGVQVTFGNCELRVGDKRAAKSGMAVAKQEQKEPAVLETKSTI
jgi:cytoskeletal protein CcmA (bactofilin family)